MKLTRKGLLKIVGDIVVNSPECPLSETLDNWNRARDFDQDDFEDCVMLTIEEAKEILGWLHNSQWKHRTDLEYAEDWQRDWIRYLKGRIKQAEAQND